MKNVRRKKFSIFIGLQSNTKSWLNLSGYISTFPLILKIWNVDSIYPLTILPFILPYILLLFSSLFLKTFYLTNKCAVFHLQLSGKIFYKYFSKFPIKKRSLRNQLFTNNQFSSLLHSLFVFEHVLYRCFQMSALVSKC